MADANQSAGDLKHVVKEALVDVLHEQRDLLQGVFLEVLEDFALSEAIREGKRTKLADRDQVDRVLRGN